MKQPNELWPEFMDYARIYNSINADIWDNLAPEIRVKYTACFLADVLACTTKMQRQKMMDKAYTLN